MAQPPYSGYGTPQPPQAPASTQPQSEAHYAAPPPAAPAAARARNGSLAKLVFLGLVLMIVAFAGKQVMLDVSLNASTALLDKTRINGKLSAELEEINAPLDDLDLQIDDLKDQILKASKGDSDAEESDSKGAKGAEEERKALVEKIDKLKKERADKDKELAPKRIDLQKRYRPLLRDASRSEARATASTAGRLQWTALLKIILDLLKIVGASLCVLAGLKIAASEDESMGLKIYATVIGGVALFGVIAGGLNALFG